MSAESLGLEQAWNAEEKGEGQRGWSTGKGGPKMGSQWPDHAGPL